MMPNSEDLLTLAVYDSATEDMTGLALPKSVLSLEFYLELHNEGAADWVPEPPLTLLLLDDGEERLLPANPFGDLEIIVQQLEAVADRLESGHDALMRTAHHGSGRFFLFEPMPRTVCVSDIGYLPDPYGSFYALKRSPSLIVEYPDQFEILYAYVAANRATLAPRWPYFPPRLTLPKATLIYAMRREARLGRKLLSALGLPLVHEQPD